MTAAWLLVILLAAVTVPVKAVGPLLLGGRGLPHWLLAPFALLAPALFGALLATQTFTGAGRLTLDARILGLVAAALGVRLRFPAPVVVALAVATTASLRFFLS